MELKSRIKLLLEKQKIFPKTIIDLGCKDIPYSDLFPHSKIIGFDKIQTIKLYLKWQKNKNLSFSFKNFNFNQEIPKSDLIISSLFLHFLKTESREKLFEQIKKSKYLLIVHLDKKINLPKEFTLLAQDEFDTEKETHDNLPEHTHHIFIELYKI